MFHLLRESSPFIYDEESHNDLISPTYMVESIVCRLRLGKLAGRWVHSILWEIDGILLTIDNNVSEFFYKPLWLFQNIAIIPNSTIVK